MTTLSDTYTYQKVTYTLDNLPPNELILGNKSPIGEGQYMLGYANFVDLLMSDNHSINLSLLWKFKPCGELMTKGTIRFAPLFIGNASDGNKCLVAVDKGYLLEKFTREIVESLGIKGTGLQSFFKELTTYSEATAQREQEKELAALAQLYAKTHGISYDIAMKLISTPPKV